VEFLSTDKRLFDKLTNRRVSADTMYLFSLFEYAKLFPADTTVVNCKPILISGSLAGFSSTNNNIDYLSLQTNCAGNQFALRLGFIPLQKGTFILSPSGMVQNCPGKRQNHQTTFSWTFDLADCNKDLIQPLALPASRKNAIEAKIDAKQTFAFRVD
jgi:hypothetical protein